MIASIDIGTSYSSICILGPDGKAQLVDISTGASMFGSKFSLPSAVFVDDSGDIQVGQAAMNSRRHRPQNFRMEFKRNLGEEIPILLGTRSFMPEELYTELFRHMKARAEKVTGESIEKTYLTYPASYREKRREKLRTAAKAAGLFDLELVDEPTAAAMCYCAEGYIKEGQTLLVYDFGGGTFDVSLIHYQDGAFQLLSEPLGLERCGGMDIDYLIAQDMRAAIEKTLPGSWENLLRNQNRFLRFTSQINELAVKAKHHLSDANCFEEYIEMGMDDVPYRLTVDRFNEMTASLVGQTLRTCRRALDEAGVSASELSAVLMVGGTSRIPLVQEMARKITGKPALCAADLELIVAQGALKYNQYRRREKTDQTPQELYEKGCEADKRHKRTEAFEWYLKAAEQGHAFAMYKVGVCYTGGGRGAKRDLEKSRAWYRKAAPSLRKMADSGNANAAFMLGDLYECRFDKDTDSKDKTDYAQAIQWYHKAADGGSAAAMEELGRLYQFGWGVAKDKSQAFQWYLKASRTGQISASGANALGDFYRTGEGIAKDMEKANLWYKKATEAFQEAAEAGDGEAALFLSWSYWIGHGVPQSNKLYAQWLLRAAELDNDDAYFYLGMNYAGGYYGFPKDSEEAIKWYRKEAELGSTYCANQVQELEKNISENKDGRRAEKNGNPI